MVNCMLYLIFLVLGIAFIVIGLKSNTERDVPVSLYLISFLWLTVQVAGVIFESLKTKFNEFPSPTYDFKLFDHTTWNGIEWLYVIGLVVYFLILLFLSIRHKWPTYMLSLIHIYRRPGTPGALEKCPVPVLAEKAAPQAISKAGEGGRETRGPGR